MLKIRPHHILCMKAYIGKGYSEAFNINMKNIIEQLKEENIKVEVVFGVDSICSKCPHNIEDTHCKSEEKVLKMDSKVVEQFNIKEKIYSYDKLIDKVYSRIKEEQVDDICSNCEWYKLTNCKKLILKAEAWHL